MNWNRQILKQALNTFLTFKKCTVLATVRFITVLIIDINVNKIKQIFSANCVNQKVQFLRMFSLGYLRISRSEICIDLLFANFSIASLNVLKFVQVLFIVHVWKYVTVLQRWSKIQVPLFKIMLRKPRYCIYVYLLIYTYISLIMQIFYKRRYRREYFTDV